MTKKISCDENIDTEAEDREELLKRDQKLSTGMFFLSTVTGCFIINLLFPLSLIIG